MNGVETVCLIEDDALVRAGLLFSLRDNGFEVVVAADGHEGFEIVETGDYDYVLTDINMPGQGGLWLIANVHQRYPHIPIIAMTGGGLRDGVPLIDLAKQAGADVCLSKPFKPAELLKALETAKRGRQAARGL